MNAFTRRFIIITLLVFKYTENCKNNKYIIPTVYTDINIYQKTPFFGWTSGLGLSMRLSKSWSIYTGLFYSHRKFKFEYEVNPEPPPLTSLATQSRERYYNLNYLVTQINIPLFICYYVFKTEKQTIYTGSGGAFLFNIKEKDWGEKYLFDINGTIDPGPYNYSHDYKKYNKPFVPNYTGLSGKIGDAIRINNKIKLTTEINYILPFKLGKKVLHYSTFSLGLGIMYEI